MVGVLGIFKAKGTKVFNELVARPSEIIGGSLTSLLPIKCALQSQIYGTFLLNMTLPLILLVVAALIMIPTALVEKRIREGRGARVAPVFKGVANIPRRLAFHTVMRSPMTADDIAEWRGPFYPMKRFAGIVVFLLFFMCVRRRSSRCEHGSSAHLVCGASHPILPPLPLHTTYPTGTQPSSRQSHRSLTART